MLGYTHLILGAGAGLMTANALHMNKTPDIAVMVGLGAIGGLLPDIDTPGSTISRRLWFVRWLFFWANHRGATHSILAAGLVCSAALLGTPGAALAVGYFSHLVGDMMTRSGVPLLWPKHGNYHILPPGLRIKTGSWLEALIGLALLALLVFWVWQTIQEEHLPWMG